MSLPRKRKSNSSRGRRVLEHQGEERKVNAAPSDNAAQIHIGASPDVEQLRSARTTFYTQTPEERKQHSDPGMANTGRSTVSAADSRRKPKAERSDGGREHRYRPRTGERQHRRDSKEGTETAGSTYVYESAARSQTVGRERGATTASAFHEPSISRRKTDSEVRRRGSVRVGLVGRPERARRGTTGTGAMVDDSQDGRREIASVRTRGGTTLPRSDSTKDRSQAGSVLARNLTRSLSMRESSSNPPRPVLKRSNTSNRGRSSMATSQAAARSEVSHDVNDSYKQSKRSSGLFSALFGLPQAPRGPEKKVECLTCLSDDIPISKSAKLGCGHIMCHDCLKRIFNLSVTDPQHMPPKCCTQEHIPLKHVDKLFSDRFKMQWNHKYQEYTTKNRIYCPNRGCGEWIKPSQIHNEEPGRSGGGRKYGKCVRCKTKVCCTCNGKWHRKRECPKDEATKEFVKVAKKQGWQRCHNCSAMVELKEGCNHMTCRCTAEFCMICGAKWKSCECPWFNYEQIQAHEGLNHFNVPGPIRVVRHRMNNVNNEAPPEIPRNYEDELERRRRQEERDEAMARRLQLLGIDDDDFVGGHGEPFGVGNAQDHFMNQDYVRAAADLLGGALNEARAAANNVMGIGGDRPQGDRHRDDMPNNAGPHRRRAAPPPTRARQPPPAEEVPNPFAYQDLPDEPGSPAPTQPQRRGMPATTAARRPPPLRRASTRGLAAPHHHSGGDPLDPNIPLRHHSNASRQYNNAAQTRPSERVVPRRTHTDFATEWARHLPFGREAQNAVPHPHPHSPPPPPPPPSGGRFRPGIETRRHSMMAGLVRSRDTEGGRVGAWLRHVEDGAPPGATADGITAPS
ncbi:MAG: hypothetical protein M1837_004680 [Sclerophora amabilis]|nr:MAG: hypothetical protein M1837_004680 [Sclerophora amabilis]